MNLLPANLATVSNVCADEISRFSGMTGVNVQFGDATHYRVEACDGKFLIRVEGEADDPEQYPSWPAMETAPNGATSAIIPAADWQRAFKAIPKAGKRSHFSKPILTGNLAIVMSEKETTFGMTDLQQANTILSRNLVDDQGRPARYPDTDTVFPKSQPAATVKINAVRLADLLRALKPLTQGEEANYSITLEFHKDGAPLVIRTEGENGQKTTALIMPLL